MPECLIWSHLWPLFAFNDEISAFRRERDVINSRERGEELKRRKSDIFCQEKEGVGYSRNLRKSHPNSSDYLKYVQRILTSQQYLNSRKKYLARWDEEGNSPFSINLVFKILLLKTTSLLLYYSDNYYLQLLIFY
jgi:hypothetical protein